MAFTVALVLASAAAALLDSEALRLLVKEAASD